MGIDTMGQDRQFTEEELLFIENFSENLKSKW